ncbi:multidrug efflux RND transporter permease subunit [Pseudooceanicola sp. CBS1P-1]|uniref:Efflux pump membrane transporter n=1 Tax=Pseudooceanicola albus TaxID=2692189 RepID=A0A6L7GAY1_9RHOB|nr:MULTISPECIES: multidrug efflux RND transporter permease subunit [Pseudooceanicola]MBT9384329.1 multidrug efflux RND transporter permease subunit [Pseudooceanicola endophyticus]MXN19933.1 multidrug efflux RND transporter permease subunit [Pseudooceanicola albus]
MAQFFIRRPVFAWVLAILLMIAGAFGLKSLAISQYPEVAPTTVRISATYTGASAQIVADSVTSVIEDGMTGLDGLLYMTSNSSEGSSQISLVFNSSTDADMAQVQVQNKLQLVQSSLPTAVTQTGVSVTRSTSSILMVGALVSDDNSMSNVELGNYFSNSMEDTVQRLEGVGSIQMFGSEYAMRIWLDPAKLYKYGLTPSDVTSAVSEQNTNVTVGSLGDLPSAQGQQVTISLKAQSQLSTVDDFRKIVLTTTDDGSSVYLGDVARIELADDSYSVLGQYDGKNAVGFGVNLQNGANAVATSERVHAAIDKLKSALPEGVSVVYPYDTTPFIQESINQIYHTLIEAIILVFVVILVFLQSWRATIIPCIAVPVVLLGTFGVLAATGLSINTLTMFALVLAIGLLVDDAIVVVENVERVMEEEHLDAVAATEKSMKEISSALVGIVVVLSSVFLPMAFMSGSTGIIYRQFSVTIISAMVLSLLVALILTPAMCASLLKNQHGKKKIWPARKFNSGMDRLNTGYTGTVARLMKRPFRMLIVVAAVGFGIYSVYEKLPSSFVPTEDQGVLMSSISLPQNATRAQTKKTVEAITDFMETNYKDQIKGVFSAIGFGFDGEGQNNAMLFVKLSDLEERPGVTAASIAMAANIHFASGRYGQVFFLQPPPIQGMGSSEGFSMYLIDQGNHGLDALRETAAKVAQQAQASGLVTSVRGYEANAKTQLSIDLDPQKAQALGLTISDINDNLSTIFAGSYVNDFTLDGKLRDVRVMGDQPYRMQPGDINDWYMRNSDDEMVPLSAFSTQTWGKTYTKIARYGGVNALELQGSAASGVSSGDAMNEMQKVVDEMGNGYQLAWTGLSYQEQLSGNQEPMLYTLSAVVVFLALAALYESWSVPFAVMLAVPVGLLGALVTALWFGQSNDVYFKVGMLTTIGLAARNAILIVEFAEKLREEGMELLEAVKTAARMRLRPILMTTFAFGLGVLPLATASGTGANAQNSIGIGMLGGIAFSAVFGIVMVPVLYVAVRRMVGRSKGGKGRKETTA